MWLPLLLPSSDFISFTFLVNSMRLYIDVKNQYDGTTWGFKLDLSAGYQLIYVPSVLQMELYKYSNHKYAFKAYFFRKGVICSICYFRTLTELYGAIQKDLQEYL